MAVHENSLKNLRPQKKNEPSKNPKGRPRKDAIAKSLGIEPYTQSEIKKAFFAVAALTVEERLELLKNGEINEIKATILQMSMAKTFGTKTWLALMRQFIALPKSTLEVIEKQQMQKLPPKIWIKGDPLD